jgi:hypothetical protein
MYDSPGDMPSNIRDKTKDPGFAFIRKNLSRPATEERRAQVGDGKGKAGQRPDEEAPDDCYGM